jgi:hypothetical protein
MSIRSTTKNFIVLDYHFEQDFSAGEKAAEFRGASEKETERRAPGERIKNGKGSQRWVGHYREIDEGPQR